MCLMPCAAVRADSCSCLKPASFLSLTEIESFGLRDEKSRGGEIFCILAESQETELNKNTQSRPLQDTHSMSYTKSSTGGKIWSFLGSWTDFLAHWVLLEIADSSYYNNLPVGRTTMSCHQCIKVYLWPHFFLLHVKLLHINCQLCPWSSPGVSVTWADLWGADQKHPSLKNDGMQYLALDRSHLTCFTPTNQQSHHQHPANRWAIYQEVSYEQNVLLWVNLWPLSFASVKLEEGTAASCCLS